MTATGIDFGTTNSVAAQWNGEYVEVLELGGYGLDADWRRPGFECLFPSVVGTSSLRAGTLFGWEAKLRSESAVEACKRMLRDEQLVTIGNRRFAATTAAAGVFRTMARVAEEEAATDIANAVVTVPANATGAARYRTREAAKVAGISVQALLNEPTAAAIAYAHALEETGEFLVFDWGGGTMDSTILLHEDGFFDEKASRGVNRLGGLEIDERLKRLVLERAPQRRQWTPSEQRQFGLDIERSKILLSQQSSVPVITPDGVRVEITQDEFSEEIQDLISRALDPVEACLEDLRMDPSELTAVLMIGGSSQIPAVRAAVSEALGCVPVAADLCNPLTAVAEGAAIAAASLNGELDSIIQVVNSHALGTVTTHPGGRRSFSTIIPRNQPLPQIRKKSYTPTKDNLASLQVEVWEGDPDKPVDHPDNVRLTVLTLEYKRRCSAQDGTFELDYTYTKEGLLEVKATLVKTGEIVLNEPVSSFGTTGASPEVEKELTHLMSLSGTSQRSAPLPTHPHRTKPAVPSVAVSPKPGKASPEALARLAATGDNRPLVVDGSNLAWVSSVSRAAGGRPRFAVLEEGVAALQRRFPNKDIHVVIDATLRHDVAAEERAAVQAAIDARRVVQPPAGTEGRGDALVVDIANAVDGVIVSNDNFAPLQAANPWLRTPGRMLGATLSQGVWVFSSRVPPLNSGARYKG
ncbi:Hsp70 family protein [Streptomyces bungoensis]|uniref:Hsp70 family protein n=1 Tax=Streptomyces bungoensis TaxID=285568 RepID=UPI00340E2530